MINCCPGLMDDHSSLKHWYRTEKMNFWYSLCLNLLWFCLVFKLNHRLLDFVNACVMCLMITTFFLVKYDRVCFIITRALGRRELGSRVLGVQYSGIFCCVLFISTGLQNMDSGSSNREWCTLHLRSGGQEIWNMYQCIINMENWENSSFNFNLSIIIWLVTVHSNLTMSRHIDVAFHILMKSYNQSYNIVLMLPCCCRMPGIHLHR